MELQIGDVIKIKDNITHDCLFAGQFGVICNIYNRTENSIRYYSVHSFNTKSFGYVGLLEDEIEPQHYNLVPMLQSFCKIMNERYNRTTGFKIKPGKFGKRKR